jgi:hypothetical protein
MERRLADHVPGSRIEWLKVIDDPSLEGCGHPTTATPTPSG